MNKILNSIKKSKILVIIPISIAFSALIYLLMVTKLFINTKEVFANLKTDAVPYIMTFLLVVLLLTMTGLFAKDDRATDFKKVRIYFIVCVLMLITITLSLVTDLYFSPYARPLALTGIFVAVVTSRKTALYSYFTQFLLILIVEGFMYNFSLDFVVPLLVNLLGGWIMISAIAQDDTRIKTIFTVVKMIPVHAIMALLLSFSLLNLTTEKLVAVLLTSSLSPILSGFLYLGLLPIFEAIFKIITPYYLSEITDITKGLLHKVSIEAPGTFSHSLEVSNLASACAFAIGEDAKLARAVALYHDIGKLNEPKVYKENLDSDELNPHDKITPELSISLIKKHVSYGVELLRREGMPKEIVNGAREHHGTLPISFFYHKATKYTDGYVNIDDYSYDGPLPSSKISAILMIVDGCEAAVRTLEDRNRTKVDELIKTIIEERMELEQFDNCAITFNDLKIIRKTLVDCFAGLYHERIEYPKLKILRHNDENQNI